MQPNPNIDSINAALRRAGEAMQSGAGENNLPTNTPPPVSEEEFLTADPKDLENLETPVLLRYIEWAMQRAGLEEQKLRAVQELLTSITGRMKDAGELLRLTGLARNVRGTGSASALGKPTDKFSSQMISDFNTLYAKLKPVLGLPELFPGKTAYEGVPDPVTGRWQTDEEIYAAAVKYATGKPYPPLPSRTSGSYVLTMMNRDALDAEIRNSQEKKDDFNSKRLELTTARGIEVRGGLTVECTSRDMDVAFRSIEEALSQLNLSNSREMANASEQLGTSNKLFELAKKAIEEYLGRLVKEIIGSMRG